MIFERGVNDGYPNFSFSNSVFKSPFLQGFITLLPENEILALSKLKAFVDDNFTQNITRGALKAPVSLHMPIYL